MNEIEKEKIAALPSQLLVTTICHPMEYAKVLIQLGFEPLPPRRSTTLFGRPAMILPNVFQYIKFIKQTDGFIGCYRGLSARVLGLIASSQLTSKVIYACGIDLPEINDPPNIITDDDPKVDDYIKLGRRDMIMHTAAVVVSYPFHVVSVRMMASFIGKEEEYCSLIGAIVSVYRDDGIRGFFHGIIPKLLGDLTCVAVTGVLAYYVNKYFVKTKDLRYYTVPLLTFVTSTITYPLVVVSTCMAVAGCSLKAGNPPFMPKYPSWQSCWRDLLRNKQHKRGSSLIFRYYIAPIAALQFLCSLKEKLAAWPSDLLHSILVVLYHPLEYESVLEQAGYEPSSPPDGLPFQILKDVEKADGFIGLYRGLLPSLFKTVTYFRIGPYLANKCFEFGGKPMLEIKVPPVIITDGEPIVEDYIKLVRRDMILSAFGLVLSHPFNVVSLRMMTAFVGKEEQYQTMFDTVVAIIKEDGVTAFYSGFISKLFRECFVICTTGALTYYVNKHWARTKDGRFYAVPITALVVTMFEYPLFAGIVAALPQECLPIALLVLTYPIEYARVLMQLGHEPLPIRETTTLLGYPASMRPNVAEYLAHIFRKDGFIGCFRGLSANLAGSLTTLKLTPLVLNRTVNSLGQSAAEFMTVPDIVSDGVPKSEDYIKLTRVNVIVHTVNMLVSYPFYVVSTRMMAAFVGREEAYNTMVSAAMSIYNENGILGFYYGFIPRIIADVYAIAFVNLLAYFVNKHLFTTKDLREETIPLLSVVSSPVTYPYALQVASTCMAVSGSSLAVAKPPVMPAYSSWLECLSDLYKNTQHKRGGALFFRYISKH